MSAIKILLVEDEKTLVQIVSETLRSKGFTVGEVDGLAFREVFQRLG